MLYMLIIVLIDRWWKITKPKLVLFTTEQNNMIMCGVGK